jgi:hypothetical protein
MTWPEPYEIKGQLSIGDYIRSSEICQERREEILQELQEKTGLIFEDHVATRTGKLTAESVIGETIIKVEITPNFKICVGYTNQERARSHLVSSIDDAAAYLKNFKRLAEAKIFKEYTERRKR